LLHGAFCNGAYWGGVISELHSHNYVARNLTIPGNLYTDTEITRANITFNDYVKFIVAELNKEMKPVVLVGHSSGGILIQAIAPLVANKISRVIFHNAFALANGTAQTDIVPPSVKTLWLSFANHTDHSIPVIPDFIFGVLMANDTSANQNATLATLVPQPLALVDTPMNSIPYTQAKFPTFLLVSAQDTSAIPWNLVDLNLGVPILGTVSVPGGHFVLFTNPTVVANGIIQIMNMPTGTSTTTSSIAGVTLISPLFSVLCLFALCVLGAWNPLQFL